VTPVATGSGSDGAGGDANEDSGGRDGAAANGRSASRQQEQQPAEGAGPAPSAATSANGAGSGAVKGSHSGGSPGACADPAAASVDCARANSGAPATSHGSGGGGGMGHASPAASLRNTSGASTPSGLQRSSAAGDEAASGGHSSQRQAQPAASRQPAEATQSATAAAAAAAQPPPSKPKPTSIFQLSLPGGPSNPAPVAGSARSASDKPYSNSAAAPQEWKPAAPRSGSLRTPWERALAFPERQAPPLPHRQRAGAGRGIAARTAAAARPEKPLDDPAAAAAKQESAPLWAQRRERKPQAAQLSQFLVSACSQQPGEPPHSPPPQLPPYDPWALNPAEVPAAGAEQAATAAATLASSLEIRAGSGSGTPIHPWTAQLVVTDPGAADSGAAQQAGLQPLRIPAHCMPGLLRQYSPTAPARPADPRLQAMQQHKAAAAGTGGAAAAGGTAGGHPAVKPSSALADGLPAQHAASAPSHGPGPAWQQQQPQSLQPSQQWQRRPRRGRFWAQPSAQTAWQPRSLPQPAPAYSLPQAGAAMPHWSALQRELPPGLQLDVAAAASVAAEPEPPLPAEAEPEPAPPAATGAPRQPGDAMQHHQEAGGGGDEPVTALPALLPIRLPEVLTCCCRLLAVFNNFSDLICLSAQRVCYVICFQLATPSCRKRCWALKLLVVSRCPAPRHYAMIAQVMFPHVEEAAVAAVRAAKAPVGCSPDDCQVWNWMTLL